MISSEWSKMRVERQFWTLEIGNLKSEVRTTDKRRSEWSRRIRDEGEKSKVKGKPKTQVQTANLGHPPSRLDLRLRGNFLVPLKAVVGFGIRHPGPPATLRVGLSCESAKVTSCDQNELEGPGICHPGHPSAKALTVALT